MGVTHPPTGLDLLRKKERGSLLIVRWTSGVKASALRQDYSPNLSSNLFFGGLFDEHLLLVE